MGPYAAGCDGAGKFAKQTVPTCKAIFTADVRGNQLLSAIEGHNPFASIYMPNETPEERQPTPLNASRRIQRECISVDDENK